MFHQKQLWKRQMAFYASFNVFSFLLQSFVVFCETVDRDLEPSGNKLRGNRMSEGKFVIKWGTYLFYRRLDDIFYHLMFVILCMGPRKRMPFFLLTNPPAFPEKNDGFTLFFIFHNLVYILFLPIHYFVKGNLSFQDYFDTFFNAAYFVLPFDFF